MKKFLFGGICAATYIFCLFAPSRTEAAYVNINSWSQSVHQSGTNTSNTNSFIITVINGVVTGP